MIGHYEESPIVKAERELFQAARAYAAAFLSDTHASFTGKEARSLRIAARFREGFSQGRAAPQMNNDLHLPLEHQAADELEDSAEDLFCAANLLERAGTPKIAKMVAAHAFEIKAIAKKLRGEKTGA
jgi:type VI protein secretion system component VasF